MDAVEWAWAVELIRLNEPSGSDPRRQTFPSPDLSKQRYNWSWALAHEPKSKSKSSSPTFRTAQSVTSDTCRFQIYWPPITHILFLCATLQTKGICCLFIAAGTFAPKVRSMFEIWPSWLYNLEWSSELNASTPKLVIWSELWSLWSWSPCSWSPSCSWSLQWSVTGFVSVGGKVRSDSYRDKNEQELEPWTWWL